MNRLRTIAAVSGIYDALVGVAMLAGRPLLAQIFAVPLPTPPIHADLNGVFLVAVAVGYLIPYRDPGSRGGRAYMWVMGPLLKGAGALVFSSDQEALYVDRSTHILAISLWLFAAIAALAGLVIFGQALARNNADASPAAAGPLQDRCAEGRFEIGSNGRHP